jgi:two-component system nitrogen regulation response regulator GlnG
MQVKMLRVLQEGTFTPVGSTQSKRVNVRTLAATNRELPKMVKEGTFREDLFHRLNVIRLRLPPLRERREDIPVLTRHFLQQSAQQLGVEAKRISESAIELLQHFAFPGNVRQLENICHWLTVMAPAQAIEPKDLPPEVLQPFAVPSPDTEVTPSLTDVVPNAFQSAANSVNAPASPGVMSSKPAVLNVSGEDWQGGLEVQAMALLVSGRTDVWDELTKRFEATLIQTALAHTRGRRIDAAHKLGIGRNTITRKIQELGLE